MPRTRSVDVCPVFGIPELMKPNMLPTYADVMRYYLYLQNSSEKHTGLSDILPVLVKELKGVWERSSIPTLSNNRIFFMIKHYYLKYRNLKKSLKKTGKLDFSNRVASFRERAEKNLFDISICKCKDFMKCLCKIKVPLAERAFLTDQRTVREMVVGNIDIRTTKMLIRRHERKKREGGCKESEHKVSKEEEWKKLPQSSVQSSSLSSNFDSPTSSSCNDIDSPSTSQMRVKLPSVAIACDRTGISDRSAAILINAALKDMGVISKDDTSKIVDRSKIRRERSKARSYLINKIEETSSLSEQGLYFDGRKDKTLVMTKKNLA